MIPFYLLFNRKPEQIVKKHLAKDDPQLFRGLSNQYVNRCLKQLAFLAMETKQTPEEAEIASKKKA